MRIATQLLESTAELQAANGRLYRLMTLSAAAVPGLDAATEITGVTTRIESVRRRLASVEREGAPVAQVAAIEGARDALARYRDTAAIAGPLLTRDFTHAVAMVRPFDAIARDVVVSLSQVTDDVLHDATARAAKSQLRSRQIGTVFAATALGIFALVTLCVVTITQRTVMAVRRHCAGDAAGRQWRPGAAGAPAGAARRIGRHRRIAAGVPVEQRRGSPSWRTTMP